MNGNPKSEIVKRYAITAAVGLVMAILLTFMRGFASAETLPEKAACISDGAFIAGVLLAGFGGLIWISSFGFFDMIGFAFHSIFSRFIPGKRKDNEHFVDYKAEKESSRKPRVYHLLIVGIVLLVISATAVLFCEL